MDETTMWCPRGDGPLVRSMANGLHETCDGCHGFAVTIWLLDEMLVDGAGPGIWRDAEQAPRDGEPCPSCRHPMSRVAAPASAGGVVTVQVCRDDELVWVDAASQPLLPAKQALVAIAPLAASGGLGSADPTHCPNCGAAYADTGDGRCRYCKQPISRPELAVTAPALAEQETAAHLSDRGPEDDFVSASIEAQTRSPF